jgi:2-dehydropantoate 2-reductase
MRIALMGSGGVGGYYGGLLARAGHDVAFVARGPHLAALRQNGLRVKSLHGDFVLPSVTATDAPAEIGAVDYVLLCVKTPDTERAVEAAAPTLGPATTVVSLQNGIDAAERIGAVVGIDRVLGGVTWISSAVEAPGVIRQVSQFRRVVLGELNGRVTPRARALVEAFGATGVAAELSQDIRRVLWTKFVFIAAISGVGALTRLPIGDYRAVPETRALLLRLMREVEALGRARGVALDADVVEKALALVDGAAPTIRTSMQRDVEAGRRSELESMVGVVCRKGSESGVPTPAADLVYAALLPVDLRARVALP